MKKTVLALILTAAFTPAFGASAQTSQKVSAGKANEYGLVYTLPSTAFDIYL